MLYTIRKGEHRARPYRFGTWFRKSKIDVVVGFGESCRYDLRNVNQEDINKLFGVGFVRDPIRALFIAFKSWWGKGIVNEEHHKDSARFGWKYNVNLGVMEIWAYCYVNGTKIKKLLGHLNINEEYLLSIEIRPDAYWFSMGDAGHTINTYVHHSNKKEWCYPLEIYFGGDEPAPHDIKIEMS